MACKANRSPAVATTFGSHRIWGRAPTNRIVFTRSSRPAAVCTIGRRSSYTSDAPRVAPKASQSRRSNASKPPSVARVAAFAVTGAAGEPAASKRASAASASSTLQTSTCRTRPAPVTSIQTKSFSNGPASPWVPQTRVRTTRPWSPHARISTFSLVTSGLSSAKTRIDDTYWSRSLAPIQPVRWSRDTKSSASVSCSRVHPRAANAASNAEIGAWPSAHPAASAATKRRSISANAAARSSRSKYTTAVM